MRKVYAWRGTRLREKRCRWCSWALSCRVQAILSTDPYCKTRQAIRFRLSGAAACNGDLELASLTMFLAMGKWLFGEGEGFSTTPGPRAARLAIWAGILRHKSIRSSITEI